MRVAMAGAFGSAALAATGCFLQSDIYVCSPFYGHFQKAQSRLFDRQGRKDSFCLQILQSDHFGRKEQVPHRASERKLFGRLTSVAVIHPDGCS